MTAKIKIASTDDAMEIIYSGLTGCVIHLDELAADFFELKNRLAGEIFQKFINYRFPLAIVIPPDHDLGQRVSELMFDHKKHPFVRFFNEEHDAENWIESHSAY